MSIAVLSIGTELTRGEITNTNCSWLCERATALGLEVSTCETVADVPSQIVESLQRLSQRNRAILCTGGLGPTTDDITAQTVAETLGVPLQRDDASYQQLAQLLEKRGRAMTASQAKQVEFPASACVLPNAHGTAPGFALDLGAARAYFMPGVPSEMKPMFELHVAPALSALVSDVTACIRLHSFGMPESIVNDKLAGIEAAHSVVLGYRAHFPEVEVKVLAKRATRPAAEAAAQVVAAEVRRRLGDVVFGSEGETLVGVVANALRQRGWRLAAAESCSGGLLSELITAEPASDFFQGSVVCYANEVKQRLLGVQTDTLTEHGAVSLAVVREMAAGAARVLGAEVALSLSGIAGPSGGTADKPVGTVCIALTTPEAQQALQVHFSGTRRQVQHRSAFHALDLLRRTLLL